MSHRRRVGPRLVSGMALATGLLASCGGTNVPRPSGSPDPGGQTLTALEQALLVLPPHAQIKGKQASEPRWSSCDGDPKTYGWTTADVVAVFITREPASDLERRARSVLRRKGWKLEADTNTSDGPELAWRKALGPGLVAEATLASEVPLGRWQLNASAPPLAKAASGC